MTSNDTSLLGDENKRSIIRIEISSMMEIPLAYQKAIEKFQEQEDDVWDAKIELKQINFESNFRRSNYECVFEISKGSYLYGR